MKRIYSICLDEKIIKTLDEYCIKHGKNRSSFINDLLFRELKEMTKKTIDIENCSDQNRKTILKEVYSSLIRNKLFHKTEYKILKTEDSVVFPSINNKIQFEVKFLQKSIKIEFRVNSSSKKLTELFNKIYKSNEGQITASGFNIIINKRSWHLIYILDVPNIAERDFLVSEYTRIIIDKVVTFFEVFIFKTDLIVELEIFKKYKITKQIVDDNLLNNIYPYIKVISGKVTGKVYILDKESVIIGRGDEITKTIPDIDLSEQEYDIKNPLVSREHAIIIKKEKKYYIKDLNSTNKTYLNQKQIFNTKKDMYRQFEIKDRDQIIFGNIIVEFYI
jgi:pSer/pThr/pTyr-binding forkhead associated (FHA) protein